MSRQQRIVIAMILLGSLIYFVILQASVGLINPPAEPNMPELRKLCSQSPNRDAVFGIVESEEDAALPIIYIITPTYQRPEMLAELTRLGQTLLLVPRIHWVIAEDSSTCTPSISEYLKKLGLPFAHISSPMPEIYRNQKYVPRGVSNRRAALQWVKENGNSNGVLYFLDDDNAVDIRIFEEMRDTEKVSMWPVGLIGKYTVSSPILDEGGEVTGFYDGWPAGRKFQVDMAGFAVNVGYLQKQKKISMPYIAGHEEDGFLKSLHIELADIEPKANSCTEILVWHTQTAKNPLRTVKPGTNAGANIRPLLHFMKHSGMIK